MTDGKAHTYPVAGPERSVSFRKSISFHLRGQEFDHILFVRKLAGFQLRVQQDAIRGEFEASTTRRDERETRNLLLERAQHEARQTDGLGFVVSNRAILEFELHGFSPLGPSDLSYRSAPIFLHKPIVRSAGRIGPRVGMSPTPGQVLGRASSPWRTIECVDACLPSWYGRSEFGSALAERKKSANAPDTAPMPAMAYLGNSYAPRMKPESFGGS